MIKITEEYNVINYLISNLFNNPNNMSSHNKI